MVCAQTINGGGIYQREFGMRIIGLAFSLLLLLSCGRNKNHAPVLITKIDSLDSNANLLPQECIQFDTITALNTKIHYSYQNGECQISWGDSSYYRTYDSLYSCWHDSSSGLWDFVPKFYSETKSSLVLLNILWTSSGGNPAPLEYYAIVLPKNNMDSIVVREFFIAADENYLVFGDGENEKIHILNLETRKSQTITLYPNPNMSRSPTLSIQDTKIKGSEFHIKYESVDRTYDLKVVEKTFKLII